MNGIGANENFAAGLQFWCQPIPFNLFFRRHKLQNNVGEQ